MIPGVQRTTTPSPTPSASLYLGAINPSPSELLLLHSSTFFLFSDTVFILSAHFSNSRPVYVDISDLSLRFSIRDFFSVFHLWLLRLGGGLLFSFGFSWPPPLARHFACKVGVEMSFSCITSRERLVSRTINTQYQYP